MPLHPLQPFARINRERARRFLGASAIRLSGGRTHRVREPRRGYRFDWIVTVADDGLEIPPNR
jgi:hypothetical protein